MIKKLDYVFSIIISLLGIIHISLTPMFYRTYSDEANIFIGMGLAFVFLGALNLNRLLSGKRNANVLCTICNSIAILYLLSYSISLKKIEPQAIVSVIVIFIPLLFSIRNLIKKV